MALPIRRKQQQQDGVVATKTIVIPYLKTVLYLIGFVFIVLLVSFDKPHSTVDSASSIKINNETTPEIITIVGNTTTATKSGSPISNFLRKRKMVKEKQKDDDNNTKKPKKNIYDCLYDIDINTIYKLENMKLPLHKKGFTMNIVRAFAAEECKKEDEEKVMFRFPIGFGGPELHHTRQEVMTVKDTENAVLNHAFKLLEKESEHHYPLLAIIEEYVEEQDNEEQGKEEESMVYDVNTCATIGRE